MQNNTKILLVVDDDPGIRSQFRWGLDEYNVITADDRVTALEQIMAHQPQVVTLDLGLPPDAEGTDEGFETLHDILDQAPNTRVVVVSGAMDHVNADKAMKSGAYGCYAKPLSIDKLRSIVAQAYQSYCRDRSSNNGLESV